MINPNDPPTDQQIHHFKPTINRSKPTINQSQPNDPNPAHQSTLIQPPTSKIQNPTPVQWERGRAMRDEREAMWDGWEISAMKLQRGESRWRNREGRERREQKKWEGWERNFGGNRRSKIFFFFCNTMNSTILCLELYCSSIAKKFAILPFTIPWCKSFLGLKCQNFLRYGISIPQC